LQKLIAALVFKSVNYLFFLFETDPVATATLTRTICSFLENVREGKIEEAGWPTMLPAYSIISKMSW
jgi:hypothetical protein